ncbi:MAG: YggS family pyridoxal phosphate-dependent enzyme [Elusimicrobia bacterium]|nr:YggS family pyridoxal phosphate-dependent enzyme [Elusimicrobiota bacterium]
MIFDKLNELRSRIQQAAQRGGRDPAKVEIVAAVKKAPMEDLTLLLRSKKIRYFGESRIQDAQKRRLELGADAGNAEWRFIGHLQSNKARAAAELFDAIDTVDSLKIAASLNAQLAQSGPKKILVQVKLSDWKTQSGLLPEELEDFIAKLRSFPRLTPCGMLAILPMLDPVEAVRPYCKELKKIFDRHFPESRVPERYLSAGMSRDFEIAVEEGANLLRIGTALFGC